MYILDILANQEEFYEPLILTAITVRSDCMIAGGGGREKSDKLWFKQGENAQTFI